MQHYDVCDSADMGCVLVQPSFEAAAKPGGYEVVKETMVVKPAGAGPTAPVTPVKEVSAKSVPSTAFRLFTQAGCVC